MCVLAALLLASSSEAFLAPFTGLRTLPVVYWGGNTIKRPANNLEMLAKMRFVIIEKWEGPCWDACLANQTKLIPCDPVCHEEENQLATLRAVKKLNASTVTVFYLNSVLDFNYLDLHAQYVKADANLRNTDGTLCHLTNDAGMKNVTVYDYSQKTGRSLWINAIRTILATGVIDGIYADQMSLFAKHESQLKGWGLCKSKYNTCCSMTAEKAASWNAGWVSGSKSCIFGSRSRIHALNNSCCRCMLPSHLYSMLDHDHQAIHVCSPYPPTPTPCSLFFSPVNQKESGDAAGG
jgi:hypothetical protein